MSQLEPGVRWKLDSFFCKWVAQWAVEPKESNVRKVARQALGPDSDVHVEFLDRGAVNRVYKSNDGDKKYIMRVALPVDPKNKTESDVATMQWVRQHTALPLAQVIAYDSTTSNDIGCEWMLLEYMPGEPLSNRWPSMSMPQKETLVKELVTFAASTFTQQFTHIGYLYPNSGTKLGEMSSVQLINGGLHPHISKGPFTSTPEYLEACLAVSEADAIANTPNDDEDLQDKYKLTPVIITRLRKHLPIIFPPTSEPEKTMLYHHDLNFDNILVDEQGKLTAVLDWELVSAVPLWKACQFPSFLVDRERLDMPLKAEDLANDGKPNRVDHTLYDEVLGQHDLTKLRELFLAAMAKVEPGWMEVYESSRVKRDFDISVENADNPFCMQKLILRWLDHYEAEPGGPWCLEFRALDGSFWGRGELFGLPGIEDLNATRRL